MPVDEWRSEGQQEFDGKTDEVAQPGVFNGDVHLLLYAKCLPQKHQKRECELLDKGLLREGNLEMLGWKLVCQPDVMPFTHVSKRGSQ